VKEGWQPNGDRSSGSYLLTVQNAYTNIPQSTIDVSPEQKGIGIKLPVHTGVNMNLHHFKSHARVNAGTARTDVTACWAVYRKSSPSPVVT
jgi:hypothetical protein